MRKLLSVAVAAASIAAASPAAAAITVDYNFTITPVGSLTDVQTGSFTVSYDAANAVNPFTLTAFNYTIGSTVFTTANTFTIGSPLGFNIYGGTDVNVTEGVNDFGLLFNVGAGGVLSPFFFEFTQAGSAGSGAADVAHGFVLTQGSGAVPEPSTWAMMLVGFGAVGFAIRRHRKHLSVQAA